MQARSKQKVANKEKITIDQKEPVPTPPIVHPINTSSKIESFEDHNPKKALLTKLKNMEKCTTRNGLSKKYSLLRF